MVSHSVMLQVFENGTYEDEAVIYFNVAQASRGVDKDGAMARVSLSYLCSHT